MDSVGIGAFGRIASASGDSVGGLEDALAASALAAASGFDSVGFGMISLAMVSDYSSFPM